MTIEEATSVLAALAAERVELVVIGSLLLAGSAGPTSSGRAAACVFSWEDVAAGADELRLGRLVVRVATPGLLYRMKHDTVRPQDRVDAEQIRQAFGLEDD